jgi:hypothetical protein
VRQAFTPPLLAIVSLATLVVPAGAAGRPRADGAAGRHLWATVNLCDTPGSPNAMGVRASMPGNGRRHRMYVRFNAHYWSAGERRWRRVAGQGVSPWIYAGSARFRARQAGWTFRFDAPARGAGFVTRATADFEWRARRRPKRSRQGRVVRRRRWVVVTRRGRRTRAGILGVDSGDPPGTSKAFCQIV